MFSYFIVQHDSRILRSLIVILAINLVGYTVNLPITTVSLLGS
jgi:hypothetical protein